MKGDTVLARPYAQDCGSVIGRDSDLPRFRLVLRKLADQTMKLAGCRIDHLDGDLALAPGGIQQMLAVVQPGHPLDVLVAVVNKLATIRIESHRAIGARHGEVC